MVKLFLQIKNLIVISTWQQLYMYDFNKVNSPIKCINKHMLDSKSTFNILNSKINYYPHIRK